MTKRLIDGPLPEDPVAVEVVRLLARAQPGEPPHAAASRVRARLERAPARRRMAGSRLATAIAIMIATTAVASAWVSHAAWRAHNESEISEPPPAVIAPAPAVPVPVPRDNAIAAAVPVAPLPPVEPVTPVVSIVPAAPVAPAASSAPAAPVPAAPVETPSAPVEAAREVVPPWEVLPPALIAHAPLSQPRGDLLDGARIAQSPPAAPSPSLPVPAAALVARARVALRQGDPGAALVLIADYLHANPDGAVVEEAMALAVQAHLALGDPGAAAAAYLQRYPDGRFTTLARGALDVDRRKLCSPPAIHCP